MTHDDLRREVCVAVVVVFLFCFDFVQIIYTTINGKVKATHVHARHSTKRNLCGVFTAESQSALGCIVAQSGLSPRSLLFSGSRCLLLCSSSLSQHFALCDCTCPERDSSCNSLLLSQSPLSLSCLLESPASAFKCPWTVCRSGVYRL